MADYGYYFRALAGDWSSPPNLDDPQPGFYKHATTGDAVAIFPDAHVMVSVDGTKSPPALNAELRCIRRGREQSREQMLSLWPFISANPVPEAEWRKVADGGDWPDEAPGLGHNRPPDDMSPEARALRVTDLAEQWLKATPTIEAGHTADQAAHYLTELRQIVADLETAQKNALRPWSIIISKVSERFTKLIYPAKEIRAVIDARLKPYLRKLDEEQRAERERVRAEAEAARAEGRRAPAKPVSTTVGGRGHKVFLKSYWRAEIVNYALALDSCGTEKEVEAAVQQVANRRARESQGKSPLPGTKAVEDRR